MFHFPDTWQLVINTGTTIVTFLMVFLIQNTQNRDAAAVEMKLNELIRTNQNARNSLLTLEDLTEDQLRQIKATFAALAVDRTGLPGVREAREDLAQAGEELEQAETKLAALTCRQPRCWLTRNQQSGKRHRARTLHEMD